MNDKSSTARCLFIINPVAGNTDPGDLEQVLENEATKRGLDFEKRRTEGAGDAARWAEELANEGVTRLIAVGGDGTLREVVCGVIKSGQDVAVAFVPAGSANVMAGVLGLSGDLEANVAIALEAEAHRFDVGQVVDVDNGYFLIAAAAGLPADIISTASRGMKRIVGALAYVASAFQHLPSLFRRQRLVLDIDNDRIQTSAHSVVVVNSGKIPGADLELVPGADPHDGLLDVLIVKARNPWALSGHLYAFLRGNRREGPQVKRGREIQLDMGAQGHLQIDGDPLEVSHPRLRVHPGAVRLVFAGPR